MMIGKIGVGENSDDNEVRMTLALNWWMSAPQTPDCDLLPLHYLPRLTYHFFFRCTALFWLSSSLFVVVFRDGEVNSIKVDVWQSSSKYSGVAPPRQSVHLPLRTPPKIHNQ